MQVSKAAEGTILPRAAQSTGPRRPIPRSRRPFKKGQSGNPGGRPKVVAEVKELAREHMDGAVGGVQASASLSPPAIMDAAAGTPTMAIIPAVTAGVISHPPVGRSKVKATLPLQFGS